MEFLNSRFVESTIRNDDGVNGAILVDSLLIRESELPYNDETNLIPLDSISDKDFLENLKGLLVFKEHPKTMVNTTNYATRAGESVGSIVNAEIRNMDGDNVVYGTLRITDPQMIDDLKNKRIKGGSLGYYASNEIRNGKTTQIGLKPNHFCLTHYPRDKEVIVFNSNQSKGDAMTKDEVVELVNSIVATQAKSNDITISNEVFNSFMQTIGSRIKDENVKAIFNSKVGIDKLSFLDNALSMKDIFMNSEAEAEKAEDEAKENENDEEKEELEKENSMLKEKIAELEAKLNEADDKENSDDEEASKEENSNESKEDEAKQNSVAFGSKKEVTNSTSHKDLSAVVSQIFM